MRRLTTGFVALALFGAAAITGSPATLLNASAAAPAPLVFQTVSLDQAQAVLDAAVAAAAEQGTLMDIAVVDAGGTLKAFASMDGAWPGSIDIAVSKARTARFFEVPTEKLGELSQPGGPLYGIETTNGGLVTFPGGLPLLDASGTVIGGIGVSGSTVENDRTVAEAGAAALLDTGVSLGTTAADVSTSNPQTDLLDLKSGGGGKPGGVVGSKNRNTGEEIPSRQGA